MRSLFDNGIGARQGTPFLGLNLPKLLQDLQPVYQTAQNLVKGQTPATSVFPTSQPMIPRQPVQPDNTMSYLLLGLLGIGGAGAAWYFFKKKKSAKK